MYDHLPIHSLIIIYIPHFRLKDDGKVDIHKEVLANEANPVISD